MYKVSSDIHRLSRILCDPTRFEVFRQIAASARPLTVKELVSHFDLHHSAIRIHLSKLERAGLVGSLTLHRHRTVGRPELAFFASPRDLTISLPPRNFELLATLALETMTRGGLPTPNELETAGIEWGHAFVRGNGMSHGMPLAVPEAMERLGEDLRRMGGNTEIEAVNGSYVLTETNCVFSPLSEAYDPHVCTLHQGAINGMLEELAATDFRLEHRSRLAAGDSCCLTVLTPA